MSSRRPITRSVKCEEPTCHDYARYEYDNQREYAEAVRRNRKYRCSRHALGRTVLSPTTLRSEWISEPSKPLKDYPSDPYRSFGSCGVLIGPNYYAEGRDFPIGTRIKITVEVLLPESGA